MLHKKLFWKISNSSHKSIYLREKERERRREREKERERERERERESFVNKVVKAVEIQLYSTNF